MLALLLFLLAGAAPAVDRAAATSALLNGLVADGDPGVAVLVRTNGRTVFERGYGVRDLRTRAPIDSRTRFRLASVTKQMTAAAIMLLVRDGRLRYEDILTRARPGFPAYGSGVTISHLLTHTGGLPDYEQLMERAEKEKGTIWTPERQIRDDEVLALLERETQGLFTPGSHIEVRGPEALVTDPVDELLVLPWNLLDEIVRQQAGFHSRGGRFLVPIPRPALVP